MRAPRNAAEREKLLDVIKDEIDDLHLIKSPRQRKAAAKDLMEYIALHNDLPCL
jgi:hypothetical protein